MEQKLHLLYIVNCDALGGATTHLISGIRIIGSKTLAHGNDKIQNVPYHDHSLSGVSSQIASINMTNIFDQYKQHIVDNLTLNKNINLASSHKHYEHIPSGYSAIGSFDGPSGTGEHGNYRDHMLLHYNTHIVYKVDRCEN